MQTGNTFPAMISDMPPDGHADNEDPVIVRVSPQGLRALAKAVLEVREWELRAYVVACLRRLVAEPDAALEAVSDHRPQPKPRGRPRTTGHLVEPQQRVYDPAVGMPMSEVVATLNLGPEDFTNIPESPLRDMTPIVNLWHRGEKVYAHDDVDRLRARRPGRPPRTERDPGS